MVGSKKIPELMEVWELANHKVTPEQVLEIRERKMSRRQLAAKFGVSMGNIKTIQQGKSWRWLLPPPAQKT